MSKFSQVIVVQKSPYTLELEAGDYWWCACGRSKTQPFCDGSHQGTELAPVKFTLTEKRHVALCGCKYSADQPFCDFSHNTLP